MPPRQDMTHLQKVDMPRIAGDFTDGFLPWSQDVIRD